MASWLREIETRLADLGGLTLEDLPAMEDLAEQAAAVLRQVEKPRTNLGTSGPPGRTD